MGYILDILGCGLITIFQLLKVFMVAVLMQFLVYRLSNKKISLYNEFRKFVMKEVNKKEQNRRGKHFAQSK